MENSSKKVIILTIFIILDMIVATTVYKVYQDHQDKLILVVEKEFAYQATKCSREDKCLNSEVTLKELYDLKYIENKLVEPKSKKYYTEDSYYNINTKEVHLKS